MIKFSIWLISSMWYFQPGQAFGGRGKRWKKWVKEKEKEKKRNFILSWGCFHYCGESMINFWSLCGEDTQTKWHKSTLEDLNALTKKKVSWTLGSTALCQSVHPDLDPSPFLFQWRIGYGQIASYSQRQYDSFIAVAWATCCLWLGNRLRTYRKVCTKKCFQIFILLKQRLLNTDWLVF